jgi:phosphoglucosamine mutase
VADEFQRSGFAVFDLGVLPTGGIAHLASVYPECALAVVISASHNPAEYNGIKLLAPTGAKVSTAMETAVSDAYEGASDLASPPSEKPAGRRDLSERAAREYVQFLAQRCWRPERLEGMRVFLDTANGAACEVAPRVFEALGMTVKCIGNSPNGVNINEECGALFPEHLSERLRAGEADIGFCFDGDSDRVIPVTRSGRILNGDHVLALAGRYYFRQRMLPRRVVVTTVMANIGLEKALETEGIGLVRTPVGDRHVYERLVADGHPLGGEQSGHLIFLPDLPTGDGILAAIRLLDVLESDPLDLDRESAFLRQYPQILKNVRVREKVDFSKFPSVAQAVAEAERELRGEGRVLLRYSGTEPLARVMLEGLEMGLIEKLCDHICRALSEALPTA